MNKVIKPDKKFKFESTVGRVGLFCTVILFTFVNSAIAKSSLSRFGITWTFDKEISTSNEPGKYQYGTFVTGDYWIVNNSGSDEPNVIITKFDPCSYSVVDGTVPDSKPRIRNGSMINPLEVEANTYHPTNDWTQGFDNGYGRYYHAINDAYGVNDTNVLEIDPCSSLVSTISYIEDQGDNSPVKRASVLTVLPEVPPTNSFRPPLAGDEYKTTFWSADDLDYSILKSLSQPSSDYTPTLADLNDLVAHPWPDWSKAWSVGCKNVPTEQMPGYGKNYAARVGKVALALHTNWGADNNSLKEDLYIGFTQLGIDLYGAMKQGMFWKANCGIWEGRKLPILFAGLALDDSNMTDIMSKTGDYLYTGDYEAGNMPPDLNRFSEDSHLFYVKQSDIDQCHGNWPGAIECGDSHHDPNWDYAQEHLGMPEYGNCHSYDPQKDNVQWDGGYRECCTGTAYPGIQLALLIMDDDCNTKQLWNHDVFFDYVDRHMSIQLDLYNKYHYRRCYDNWTADMWDEYRDDYGCRWTRYDPNDRYSNGYNPCDSNRITDPNNQPPVLNSIGNKTINENEPLSFEIEATDPEGTDDNPLTYDVQNKPEDASFTNQWFKWTPTSEQVGEYQVTFIVTDPQGAQDDETITITVNDFNGPPEFDSVDAQSVDETDTLTFQLSATDPDGEDITYSFVGTGPSGAVLSEDTGTFTWTPGYDQAGVYDVNFAASDGGLQDTTTVSITVNNVDRNPALSPVADQSTYTGQSLSFSLTANDPDGDTISYSASGLPDGADLNSSTGQFSWTPGTDQGGSYDITFYATAGGLQDSQTASISVTADNTAPAVSAATPSSGQIQVSLNNLVALDISDDGTGIDANTVDIKLNGETIYTGNTASYSSSSGTCRRTGDSSEYTFVYQSDDSFDFGQTMTVTASADDLAGNSTSGHSYNFKTKMRSFGENQPVYSNSSLASGSAGTVFDSSGNIWVIWHSGAEGSRNVYIAKRTSGADNFGNAVQLTSGGADQCNPDIAIAASGKLYAVWQDSRDGYWDIYLKTSADGVNWSSDIRVSDSNADQTHPSVVLDNSSPANAYVFWEDDRNGNQDIYVASSDTDFAFKSVSQITTDSSAQTRPAAAVDSAGNVYVLWTDNRGGNRDIYGAASNSGPWSNVAVVSKTGTQSNPVIASEASGSILHLLWVDDSSGNKDIFYTSSTALTDVPLAGSSIIDTENSDQLQPAIIVSGSTGNNLKVFACWQDKRNVSTSRDTDLYFYQIGSAYDENIFVGDDSTSSNQQSPAIGMDSEAHPYLVWLDNRNSTQSIYYAGSTYISSQNVASTSISQDSSVLVGTALEYINSTEDVSLSAPEGAYSSDISITISEVKNPPRTSVAQLSKHFEFGPSGVTFSQPVTVTIPYRVSSNTNPAVYWYDPLTGTLSQQGISNVRTITISSDLNALRFDTRHFTQFFIGGGSLGLSGGGGGGGGGCALSHNGRAGIFEYLVPYIILASVMLCWKLKDARKRRKNFCA